MNGNPKNILPMLARELDNPLKDWFNVFETSSAPIVDDGGPDGPDGPDADADADVDVDVDGVDAPDDDVDPDVDAIINYKI